MCGRFSLAYSITEVCSHFHLVLEGLDWKPRYNIAPAQNCLVITQKEGKRQILPMIWGLIPSFTKDRSKAYKSINARAETLTQKPTFRRLLKTHRCLIPADGFYEWIESPSGKLPIRVVAKDQPIFAFAGLWDIWLAPDNSQIQSFTIVTTEANDKVRSIHDRMPVILTKESQPAWIDTDIDVKERLSEILKPYPAEQTEFYEVSQVVNSWKNDVPECILKK